MKTLIAGIALPLACALSLALAGCGSSTPDADADGGTTPTTPPPAPAATNAPYHIAASNDLAIFMTHVHQDFYADPVHFAFWWDVRSTFSTVVPSIAWKLERLDGIPQPALTGTITNLSANHMGVDGHNQFVQWIEQQPGSHHRYQLSVNYDRAVTEASYDNDTYIFEVDVPDRVVPSQDGDLEFKDDTAHIHMWMPDAQNAVHFEARNRLATAIPPTKWRVRDALEGLDVSYDLDAIPAGGTAESSHLIQLLTPGLHTLTITLDALNEVAETNEANNVSTLYILVGAPTGVAKADGAKRRSLAEERVAAERQVAERSMWGAGKRCVVSAKMVTIKP